LWLERDHCETVTADANEFLHFVAKKHENQGWQVALDDIQIVIPNPTRPTCEIYDLDEFEQRFRGDYFDDLLIEFAQESELEWEEPWIPGDRTETQEEQAAAWRAFRREQMK